MLVPDVIRLSGGWADSLNEQAAAEVKLGVEEVQGIVASGLLGRAAAGKSVDFGCRLAAVAAADEPSCCHNSFVAA